ncbi:MAG TPA: lysylphosphatidylglycerol synthase transmembrane domain-containing protein [Sphingobium sp.]|nr:lysylphosphatidylglycerol synthase transmembrane domain-containing protein [Sphingobium sp.]
MTSHITWWNQTGSQLLAFGDWCAREGRRAPVRLALHAAVGLGFLWLFLRQVDLGPAIAAVGRASILPLAIALVAYAADFLLRAARFWLLLMRASNQKVPWARVPGPFIASFGISDLLPLRAGDVFRLLWFQRNMGLRSGTVLGAMMVERFFDLFTLLLLGLGIFAWQVAGDWLFCLMLLTAVCGLAGLLVLISDRLAERARGIRHKWVAWLLSAIGCFQVLRSPRLLLGLTAMSLFCWLLEAVVMLGAWISLNGAVERWAAPMAAFVGSTLGTLFPGLPGHFGTFELFGLEIFSRSGVEPGFAAAVLLLAHLLLWAPTALFAILWLPLSGSGKTA